MTILIFFKLLSSIFVLLFGFFAYFQNKFSKVNQAFLKLTIAIFIWTFSFSFASVFSSQSISILCFKIGYMGIVFIPGTFFEFITSFLNQFYRKVLVNIIYLISLVLTVLIFNTQYIILDFREYSWGLYPIANHIYHPFFLVFFMGLFTMAFIFLVLRLLAEKNLIQTSKIRYVFIGSLIASFGSVDFIPNYGFEIYPFGFIFMFLFPLIFAYAIVKYRLMDITIALTRTTIFIVVYSLVLGAPFATAFIGKNSFEKYFGENWWIIPLLLSTVLASLGPYIYSYIQRRAEDKLLQEQRRYQSTLRQASLGMGRVKDLKRLLQLIVHIVTRSVRIEHCEIFLFHEDSNQYVLKASKSKTVIPDPNRTYPVNSILIQYINRTKEPIVYEEIKQKSQDFNDAELIELEKILKELDAALVVPSFIEDRLIAIIVLGKKLSGELYSMDDLVVFAILANQSALAIENAQFYDDMKKTHAQLFKAEKMATLGTMADGLSHQINNRFHAMGFMAGDALDTIKLKKENKTNMTSEQVLNEVQNALERIQDNVKRGGEIVGGLLKYSRKGQEGFEAVDLGQVLKSSFEMASFKIKIDRMKIVRNFNENTPKIYGNFTQLQEVFFNMIDNAYDAMMQRKEELGEDGYQPTLTVSASKKGKNIEILIEDNGIGVKEEDVRKLFTPFFTTKLSSKKGTGLGLYVIRQIIEDNHKGKVQFASEYKKGSIQRLILPIARDEKNEG